VESNPGLHKRLKLLTAGEKRRREEGEGRREYEKEGCTAYNETVWVGGLVSFGDRAAILTVATVMSLLLVQNLIQRLPATLIF
jgi:hypothetical protein